MSTLTPTQWTISALSLRCGNARTSCQRYVPSAMRTRNWPERLAGFFAAKEAPRKAFGHAIPWNAVGVSHERSGKPVLLFYDAYADLPSRRGVTRVHLTITHTAAIAAAVVILER